MENLENYSPVPEKLKVSKKINELAELLREKGMPEDAETLLDLFENHEQSWEKLKKLVDNGLNHASEIARTNPLKAIEMVRNIRNSFSKLKLEISF